MIEEINDEEHQTCQLNSILQHLLVQTSNVGKKNYQCYLYFISRMKLVLENSTILDFYVQVYDEKVTNEKDKLGTTCFIYMRFPE